MGNTCVDPEVPDAVKPPPLQEAAFVDFQVSMDCCPKEIVPGLAASVAVGVGAGGGGCDDEVIAAVVHGVSVPPLPKHPSSGFEGLDVCPYGSSMAMPFVASVRFGFMPLADTGSTLACK